MLLATAPSMAMAGPPVPSAATGQSLLIATESAEAEAPVVRLHDALLSAMKSAGTTPFAARKQALQPVILETFNLPAMTEVAAGPFWGRMSQDERQEVIAAFSDFSVSTYAARFNDFSGQRFEVVGHKAGPQDSVWVLTRLVGGGEPVSLNYLVRRYDGGWRIVDVYLKGSISELANRRSEFTSTLRRSGVAGLLKALNDGSVRMAEDA
jgi:phospholipid transport system substrate-binding protein